MSVLAIKFPRMLLYITLAAGVIVGVVVAVVVVIILVMAFVIYKKRHVASGKLQDQGTDLQTDYPFSQFRGSTHSSTTGIENKSYETHNI